MVIKTIRHVILLCFILSFVGIGALGRSTIDGSEYAVKTVKSEYGDMYDCVDFYKQPAFNHPLLKNHSFHPQMRPTYQPQRITDSNGFWMLNATKSGISLLKDGGCPQGTVPIRRMNKSNDSSGTNVHPQRSSKANNQNTSNDDISGTIIALGQTKADPSKVYNGVGATVSIYNPRALPSQYSSAEVIVRGGPDSLIAGWTVNPNKYHDNRTRLFIYANAGNMHCFDSECGFVIVRTDVPLDFVFSQVSRRGDEVFVTKFFIYRDLANGNWWLQVGAKDPITVGFWPQRIFTGLASPATYAACGGEAYTLATVPPPEMGAGYYPDFAPFMRGDAYCTDFVVVDEKNTIVDASNTEAYWNNKLYGAYDTHMRSGQHVVTFGGP